MNDMIYNYVRDSIKSGRSVDEVMAEISKVADVVKTAEAEKPTTSQTIMNSIPLDELRRCGFTGSDGKIILRRLTTVVAGWMIQNGFNPDGVLEVDEIIDTVETLLKDDLNICSIGINLVNGQSTIGSSIDSLLKGLMNAVGKPITQDFNRKH